MRSFICFAVYCWAAGVAYGGDPIFWVREWGARPVEDIGSKVRTKSNREVSC